MKTFKDGSIELTKSQRILIYNKALDKYQRSQPTTHWRTGELLCEGMCIAVKTAIVQMYRRTTLNTVFCPTNFPEYFSYAPKSRWAGDTAYWFTRRISRGGRNKRIEILTALAKGKSKGE